MASRARASGRRLFCATCSGGRPARARRKQVTTWTPRHGPQAAHLLPQLAANAVDNSRLHFRPLQRPHAGPQLRQEPLHLLTDVTRGGACVDPNDRSNALHQRQRATQMGSKPGWCVQVAVRGLAFRLRARRTAHSRLCIEYHPLPDDMPRRRRGGCHEGSRPSGRGRGRPAAHQWHERRRWWTINHNSSVVPRKTGRERHQRCSGQRRLHPPTSIQIHIAFQTKV